TLLSGITQRGDCASKTNRSDSAARSKPSIPKAQRLRCPLATYRYHQRIPAALHPERVTTEPRIRRPPVAIHPHPECIKGSPAGSDRTGRQAAKDSASDNLRLLRRSSD